jgi:hypothetical protein
MNEENWKQKFDELDSRVGYLFDLYACKHIEGHHDRIESIECRIKELLKENLDLGCILDVLDPDGEERAYYNKHPEEFE